MTRLLALLTGLLLTLPAQAQEQQAGNAASTDTEGTFQALVDKCDDVDALMLRARIRLMIPRTTEASAVEAQKMLDKAFAVCGGGDLEKAKSMLNDALVLAEAGTTENFGTDASLTNEAPKAVEAASPTLSPESETEKPWWQFW
jgi:hypothetical protein